MKEMNRREFLTLTGAAVVALSLAGCGAPSAPAAPTGKEAKLAAAINRVWKEKFDAGEVVNEQLTLNQDAVGLIRGYGCVFENANRTPHKLTDDDRVILSDETGKLPEEVIKYGEAAGMVCVTGPDTNDIVALEYEYSCEDTVVRDFVDKLLTRDSKSANAEFISICCPVVQNKTYMTAVVFRINKP
ncbi:twin-arginine translocation signal domain-containing protein [Faecalibacterium sp. HTF-128]|uniref:Twin-arginine translocation signal domain-containing protein n=1 Tax=Faecalibacterium wellingii TaxID=2929491 RepID=A0AB35YBY3_9FIRM